jgi:hypothetical protein
MSAMKRGLAWFVTGVAACFVILLALAPGAIAGETVKLQLSLWPGSELHSKAIVNTKIKGKNG